MMNSAEYRSKAKTAAAKSDAAQSAEGKLMWNQAAEDWTRLAIWAEDQDRLERNLLA